MEPLEHQMIEAKWWIWLVIAVFCVPAALWTYNEVNRAYWNSQYIAVGKAVDCRTRPYPKALRCDPRVDGVACDHGTRGWLRDWHEPIDYACAQFGPEPVFVFRIADEEEQHLVATIDQ